MRNVTNDSVGAWVNAARLLARWLEQHERVDALLDALPPKLSAVERARCQHLVFGVIRHCGRIGTALDQLIAHRPRFSTRAALMLAGFELIDAADEADYAGQVAKIGHHAVEQTKQLASPAEARLVNAVVRKLAPLLAQPAPPKLALPEMLADYFSHPAWLVKRWLQQFGAEPTRRLLEWNQTPARLLVRRRDPALVPPEFLSATPWPEYFEAAPGHWSELEALIKAGKIFVQDPATRHAIEALNPQAGEAVLDLCAAPGGKSVAVADAMNARGGGGRIVALDLPGPRIERLRHNLAEVRGVDVALVQADLLKDAGRILREHGLPLSYTAVLLDAPCSNTGVMRHRIDVKWRLQENDFRKHARQQLSLLHAAARLVLPGGRLVYSTCSIDADENEGVVQSFRESKLGGQYTLERTVRCYPWEDGHDGVAVFLLRRGDDQGTSKKTGSSRSDSSVPRKNV
ncbi:MAG: RsmB/NOP family class I SAM-dependent RNA methyltransferase [Opitutaceae bacterium]|nr:RsmB/NOP family class I SAM-dependent RNA methyltransferase [Opitutaceae bacterium]